MTREQTIEGLAKQFAARNGHVWDAMPVGKTVARQRAYRHEARAAVDYVEHAIRTATANEWDRTAKTTAADLSNQFAFDSIERKTT